jgi:nitrous oxide reductase
MVILIVAIIGAAILIGFGLFGRGANHGNTGLPSYCTTPQNGYLIVASSKGFNDSVDHGVPSSSWPIINVTKGSVVEITVCNIDQQAHGFQVQHYFDTPIETISPGNARTISFSARESGTFRIYCSIFCTVHWAMQSGELRVS